MTSSALTHKTFVSVWSFFFPLSLACCAAGSRGLAHAKQAPLHHLEAVRFHIREHTQQSILRGRQRAIMVHAKLVGRPRLPIKAPRHHMRVKRGLEGGHSLLQRVERHAGAIQERCQASLQIGTSYTSHVWCLWAGEAPYILNRDNLKKLTRDV